MSRILKLNSQSGSGDILSLSVALGEAQPRAAKALTPAADPAMTRLLEEHAILLRRLEQQETVLSDLRKEVDTAFRKGEAQGHEAGRRAAEDASAAALARLEGGIRQAASSFVEVLSGLERLAPALAREALAAILGAQDDRAELVTAVVKRHLRTLEAQSILQIDVSRHDFGDEAALAALAQALGASGLRIQAQSALKSGDCRIQLKLGTLDVGLDQQWGRLGALLDQMARPAGEHRD